MPAMRPTWVSTMDAELFGGDEAPLRIVANSTLPPLPGFTPPARLVAVPVAPKPPPAPAPPVLKSGVNPFGKPPPAAPKSVAPDIATGPVIVFFNYHSVAAPVSNIQGIIDYVEETLGQIVCRVVCCCDVRFVPMALMDFINSKQNFEIAQCFSASRDEFDSFLCRKIRREMALSASGPGTLVIVTDEADLREALWTLKKRNWTSVLFTPALLPGCFEKTADFSYPLPVSSVIHSTEEYKKFKKSTTSSSGGSQYVQTKSYAILIASYPQLETLSPVSGPFLSNDRSWMSGDEARPRRGCCPFYNIRNHRAIGCSYYHPKQKCRYFPDCDQPAEQCVHAHPFCSSAECRCVGDKDPYLNHYKL